MKNMIQKTILLVAMAGALSPAFIQQPAAAFVADPATVAKLQDARNSLIIRESRLLRDQDDLQRQIWDLKRRNDPRLAPELNNLLSKSDAKYADIQKTRWELRQVEQSLL
jgi:hypothetical protein